MDDEGEEREREREKKTEVRRHRIPETSLEESKRDQIALAVTTQESSDGIREKAMRNASIEELETGSGSTVKTSLLSKQAVQTVERHKVQLTTL